ncbi:type III-B CRISPR-associated protein Cas10/Cmr2 [Bacillaceae bacterium SIJ1]|uniref:type III-B CRISPR-associated protein Cas10/Cmr2 n=1 Tax=Litoribacterium kuwaitense TaxID=1398745 RepID=UPI0013ECCAF8|nr:type III-B CRISPR-associated protein Cas10/Cmr2 [Litoribacterium kuwaitense]NGP44609.1 type III-B CRISPR-associated protein Cas10/Cmr2 [Litoribacterium kuwaitense]
MKQYLAIITLSGVQSFIEQSRKTGDLWAGSQWMAKTMDQLHDEIIKKYSFCSVIFPQGVSSSKDAFRVAFPNRIVLLLKGEQTGEEYEREIQWIIDKLQKQAVESSVRQIKQQFPLMPTDLADKQLRSLFKFHFVVTSHGSSLKETMDEAEQQLRTKKKQFVYQDWMSQPEHGLVCPVCQERTALTNTPFTPRLSMGKMKQIAWETWTQLWEKAQEDRKFVLAKENEALCAVCLSKRLRLKESKYKFPSLDVIAEKKDPYYGLLMMDGDQMGDRMKQSLDDGLGTYQNLSQAITEFAQGVVPDVFSDDEKLLIYAGGDDVMSFLPRKNVLQLAGKLRFAFSQSRPSLNTQTASMGIVIAHRRQPLRHVLAETRKMEALAKAQEGKNSLALTVFLRSGTPLQASLHFGYHEEQYKDEVEKSLAVIKVLPNSFLFELEKALLPGLLSEKEMIRAELKRVLNRSEAPNRLVIEGQLELSKDEANDVLMSLYDRVGRGASEEDRLQQWIAMLHMFNFIAKDEIADKGES